MKGLSSLSRDFTNVVQSAFYRSNDSDGGESKYWNFAVGFDCLLSSNNLIKRLKNIEKECGRNHSFFHPRQIPLDLDLVFLVKGDVQDGEVEYCLDYSFICENSYFIIPLANLYPSWIHPSANVNLTEAVSTVKVTSPLLEEISGMD